MKKYKRIVIDLETTGLNPNFDEILEIAMIDQDGKTVLHAYSKPERIEEWQEAERVHGITPDQVKNCKTFNDLIPRIKEILEESEELVAYNAGFERAFLHAYGIDVTCPAVDPMLLFAPIYGEWSDAFDDYKWQRLETCAAYYDYTLRAHNALEDAKATLYCLKHMEAAA